MQMSNADLEDLKYAKNLLENPSMAAKLTNILGSPIEKSLDLLPEKYTKIIHEAAYKSLDKALEFAIVTLGKKGAPRPNNMLHRVAIATTGATGGAFGLAALPIELPISTIIMLRSIADIARSQNEDIQLIETKLACLEVFALGGKSQKDNATETGYYAIRAALANAISEAAKSIAEKGLSQRGTPPLVRFITTIASRFGIVVSEKAAAMAVPVIGAAGGALINTIFIDHFQDMARGHFIMRRLERLYGKDIVQSIYERV